MGFYSTIRLYDAGTGKDETQLKQDDADLDVKFLTFSPSSGIWITRISSGSAVSGPKAVCFALADSAVVIASDFASKPPEPPATELSVWDIKSGKLLRKVKVAAVIRSIVSSADGKLVAACSGASDNTTIVNASTGKQVSVLKGRCADFSVDGRFMAVGAADGKIRILDLKSDAEFKETKEISASASVDFVKFVAGGTKLIAQSMSTTKKPRAELHLQVWQLASSRNR